MKSKHILLICALVLAGAAVSISQFGSVLSWLLALAGIGGGLLGVALVVLGVSIVLRANE